MKKEEKEILEKINWNLWEIDDGLGYFLMMALMFSLIMGTMLLMHGYSENNFHEKAAGIGRGKKKQNKTEQIQINRFTR